MARQDIGGVMDDNNLNKVNHNFIELYDEIGSIYKTSNNAKQDAVIALTNSLSAKQIAQLAQLASENTQQQLDDIILNDGTGNAEVIQARGGEPLLKDRLNKNDKKLSTIIHKQIKEKFDYSDVKLIGHRGLSGLFPENTIPAFEQLGKRGVWGAECDVQLTKDGAWILMHDLDVNRTTNGTGLVKDYTLSQIKELEVIINNNHAYPKLRIPTLEEYLFVCRRWGMVALIELKDVNATEEDINTLITILNRSGMVEKSVIQSYGSNLNRIRNVSKDITIGVLANPTEENIIATKKLGNAIMIINKTQITNIHKVHEQDIKVCVWTANTFEEYMDCVKYGADFIMSDYILGGI